jgi:hypothetical protein
MAFQEEQTSEVQTQPGGYGGFCGGIVRGAVSLLRADGTGWTVPNAGAMLPVDVAVSSDGSQVTLAAAGAVASSQFSVVPPIVTVDPPTLPPGTPDPRGDCPPPPKSTLQPPNPGGEIVAVAIDSARRLVVQTREPMLIVGNRAVVLPGEVIRDTGHEIFHMGTAGGIACASCHPEGREDGHVWKFAQLGARRTQSLGGGGLGTGPFHWSGDMRDFHMLADEVFSKRMTGPGLLGEHVQALSGWIDRIPAWKPGAVTDQAAADRGRAVFNDATVACATCHSGQTMTTRAIVDVGTGAPFKVPSLLGVGFRAPFMHNGCATTLQDRFGECGGVADKHGHVSLLTDIQRADLVSYLDTL